MIYFFESRQGIFFYAKTSEGLFDSSPSGVKFDSLTLPSDFKEKDLKPYLLKINEDSFWGLTNQNLESAGLHEE